MRTGKVVGVQVGCLLLVLAAAGPAAEIDMKPGEWEITSTGSVEGVGDMPPQTNTRCLTLDDLVPKSKDNDACAVSAVKIDGNQVSWTVACEDAESGMKGDGRGAITYAGETFEGGLTMTMTPPDQPAMKMTAQLKGRRIGACSESE